MGKSKSKEGKLGCNTVLGYLGRVLRIALKALLSLLLLVVLLAAVTSLSPIYDFKTAKPFCGPDIYNPYRDLDTTRRWQRANFHTHTRVEGIMNECDYWPAEVLKAYEGLGYDIVTFSNHNELTTHPTDEALQVNVYEHGYNLFKYHKLVFGADEVCRFDHLLPLLASQKQFQIELLAKDADLVQVNHPLRTPTLSAAQLEKLSGYRLIELDSGHSIENEYWDSALSAGRYSFGVANDDLHYPDRSGRIAIRCNFVSTPSAKYEDILAALNSGCFYSMRVPDYGEGDWEVKRARNTNLPHIENIGLKDSTIFVCFSEPAHLVKVIGAHHKTLAAYNDCDKMSYAMLPDDPYARIIAHFPDGEVIYTNPFARYDASLAESPFDCERPQINIPLTIAFNLLLAAICVAAMWVFRKYIIKR